MGKFQRHVKAYVAPPTEESLGQLRMGRKEVEVWGEERGEEGSREEQRVKDNDDL